MPRSTAHPENKEPRRWLSGGPSQGLRRLPSELILWHSLRDSANIFTQHFSRAPKAQPQDDGEKWHVSDIMARVIFIDFLLPTSFTATNSYENG
jgi:hypothetical protein